MSLCGLEIVECLIERLGRDFSPHISHGELLSTIHECFSGCTYFFVFGRPFVKRFALSIGLKSVCLSVRLSVMSVTLVPCDQMVGWIKTKLAMRVGLGPVHIVLDGDPPPPPPNGHSSPNFRPISVVAKWLDR